MTARPAHAIDPVADLLFWIDTAATRRHVSEKAFESAWSEVLRRVERVKAARARELELARHELRHALNGPREDHSRY